MKLYENEPKAGPIQFTGELHEPEMFDLYSYPPMLELAES